MEWLTPQTVISGLCAVIMVFVNNSLNDIKRRQEKTHDLILRHIMDKTVHK